MDSQTLIRNTFAEGLPLWDSLSESEQLELCQHSVLHDYAKGTSIHGIDTQCAGMLYVRSGTLRVYMLSEDGRDITLYRVTQGDVCILSASCVLSSITFDVHIDTVADASIIQTGAAYIASLIEKNIYAELFAYRLSTERFSDVMWAMQQILFMSFDKRLAVFLLDESVAEKSDTLHITHEQIARLMGSAREVVTRMLKYFSEEGYVTLSRGSVTISDRPGLRTLLS